MDACRRPTRIRMDACIPAAAARPLEAALRTASLDGFLGPSVMAFVHHMPPFATQHTHLRPMYPDTCIQLGRPTGPPWACVSRYAGPCIQRGQSIDHFGARFPGLWEPRATFSNQHAHFGPMYPDTQPHVQLGRSIGPLWAHAPVPLIVFVLLYFQS